MESKKQRKYIEIYETQFQQNRINKDYAKIHKLLLRYSGLEGYLTKAEAVDVIKYLLDKNNSDIKEMTSGLKKILDKLDNKDKLK